MKLVVQADDYAMTDAIAEGILKCAREGILTQTGLMTNGPHAEFYGHKMESECPHIALGQEINLVSGVPVSDPKDIPTLVDENGRLIRSVIHKQIDKTDPHHTRYEDSYREIEAQYLKYLEITGHKPYFFGLHSYHNEEMMQAMNDIIKKYEIRTGEDVIRAAGVEKMQMGPWYDLSLGDNKDALKFQYEQDPIKMWFEGKCGYITDLVGTDKCGWLHTHAAFLDREVIDMSTLHITRVMELDLLCSPRIKQWVKDNNVQLVNSRDLLGSLQ